MILSIFSGKEAFSAVLMDNRTLKGTIVHADGSKLDGFISENRKTINKAVILLSDHFNEYFLHTFENAEEDDIEKAAVFRVKDLITHPLNKSAFTHKTVRQNGNSVFSVSAVSPLAMVKKLEDLMSGYGIREYSVVPASLFLLNLRDEPDFAQLLTADNITTSIFVSENNIKYIRKTPAGAGLNETFKFYNEEYNKYPVKSIFSIGRNIESVYSIPAVNVTVKTLLKTDNEAANGLEALIGAALCV